MNAVNTALFILVWTFTAVCRADEDFNLSCDDVSGFVGKEVNLTCKVSLPNNCYIINYMFKYPKESICKEEFPKELREQRNSIITCSYTPTTAMTEIFRFSVPTTCGMNTAGFTVNIADPSLRKADEPEDTGSEDTGSEDTGSEDTGSEDTGSEDTRSEDTGSEDTGSEDTGSKDTVISSVVGLLVIIILIIILMTFIYKKQYFRFPFLCIKHNEDSNCAENVI